MSHSSNFISVSLGTLPTKVPPHCLTSREEKETSYYRCYCFPRNKFWILFQGETNCFSCTKRHDIEIGQALSAAFFGQRNVMQKKIITFSRKFCLYWHLCSRHHLNIKYLLTILECIPDKISHSKKMEHCLSGLLFNAYLLCTKKRTKRNKTNPVSPIVLTLVSCTRGQPNEISKYVISHLEINEAGAGLKCHM